MKNRTILKAVERGDEWTPRAQRGGIYCSPRCGCKCTRAAFDLAVKESGDLAARLGEGWTTRVWENCGWHWEVVKGPVAADRFNGGGIVVSKSFVSGRYGAEFRSASMGSMNCTTQFFAHAATAEEAIGLVRQDVRTFISRIEADLEASI